MLRVMPKSTGFPTNIRFTPVNSTPLNSMPAFLMGSQTTCSNDSNRQYIVCSMIVGCKVKKYISTVTGEHRVILLAQEIQ